MRKMASTFRTVKFVLFNCVLPCADVALDFLTFLAFYQAGHVYWAVMTISWMFLPFLANILFVFCKLVVSYSEGNGTPPLKALKMILLHFPFILPFRNLYNAYDLKNVDGPFFAKHIEAIYQEAEALCMLESYFEAGPQMVTQLVIILSTGGASYTQLASLPISFFSLSLTASKVFFTLRGRTTRDTDPSIKMVMLTVLPWMMMAVLSSIIMWTFMGGLLGEYVLIGIFINMGVVFTCLKIRHYYKRVASETLKDELEDGKQENTTEQENTDQNETFHTESSLTSVWVPSIVGSQSDTFWISRPYTRH